MSALSTILSIIPPFWRDNNRADAACHQADKINMPNDFTESVLEGAALSWFGELGYSFLAGQEIAPGEAAVERS